MIIIIMIIILIIMLIIKIIILTILTILIIIIAIIKIVIQILIDSYKIIKSKDIDNVDENNAQNKHNNKIKIIKK